MDFLWPCVTEEQKLAAYEEATKILNERLEKIMNDRANASVLTDLDKTHILCVDKNKCYHSIPAGKIYMDRIDNRRGDLTFGSPVPK
jgi:hypothetical protein